MWYICSYYMPPYLISMVGNHKYRYRGRELFHGNQRKNFSLGDQWERQKCIILLFYYLKMILKLDHFMYVLFNYFSGKPMSQKKQVSQLDVGYSY